MLIQVHHDNHVTAHDDLIRDVEATVADGLGRHAERVTRVEVHLKDVNGHKGGDADKHCTVEARPAGHQPIAVTHAGATIDQALDGAVKKLRTTLDRTLGKLGEHKGSTPVGGEPGD